MTSPTPSPDATEPGSLPAEVLRLATEAWRRVTWDGDSRAMIDSIARAILADRASRAAPTDQPEAPGVEAARRIWNEGIGSVSGSEVTLELALHTAERLRAALSTIPNEERIRREAAEERIREDERAHCIELASKYCWARYKDRAPAHLKGPAVFTSHEWQKIAEAMRAELEKADADRAAKRTEAGL